MKFKNITKTIGMTALGVALATGIYAARANAEEAKDTTQAVEPVKKPSYNVYAGSLLYGPKDKIDNIVQVDNKNGARAIVETNNTPWTNKVNETSVALRSPQIGILQGEASYDNSNASNHSYTGIVTGKLSNSLTVRAGAVGGHDLGGFVGGKTSLEGLTLNGNVFRHEGSTNANGYVSFSAPLSQNYTGFVSVGGSTNKDQIVSVAGIISDGKAGFYNQIVVDEAKNEQSGKFIVVPAGFRYTSETFDFKSTVLTNAEMNGEFTPNTMIGWAPYDANAANGTNGHSALVGKWKNNEAIIQGSLGYWNRPRTSLLFGITPKVNYDRTSREATPSLIGDIYSDIPGTPLGAALEVEQNLRDGSAKSLIYVGYSAKF